MKRIAGMAAAAAIVALLPAARGAAQEPKDTVRLKELVVTATRTPVPRSALPLATSVVTGEELREKGIRSVADALRTLPGVALAAAGSEGGLTSLFMRGGNSGYVKVLVDGVAVNDAGGGYDFSQLSTQDVERIEVVRGPASVLYGTDAVSGVVQIFTRQGAGSTRAHAAFSGGHGERIAGPAGTAAGGYGVSDFSADAAGGGRLAGWSLGAARHETGGLYPQNNGFLNTTLSGRLDLHPGSRSDAALTLRRTGGYFHFPTDEAGNVVDANAATRTDTWTLALDAGHRFGALDARLLLGSNETRRADLDAQDGPADTLGTFASDGHTFDRRRSADLHLDWRASTLALLTVGAAIERESEGAHSWYLSQWGDGRDSSDVARTDRGVYAQALAQPARGISLTGGVRLDDNSRFGRFTTWRAGASWRILAATRLRLAAGTAFKEPTFYQNFAHGFVIGNPALRPERSSSWEAGVEQGLAAGRLSLRATWFAQRFRDLIQYQATSPTPGAPNYFNLGAASADGLELSAGADAGAGVRVDASYTYLRTRVTDEGAGGDPSFVAGEPLLRRPAHTLALTLGWRPSPAGALSGTLSYVGSREDLDFSDPNAWPAPRVTLAPYARLDLAGERTLLGGGHGRSSLTGTFRLENALDRRYCDIADFPARGRVVYLGARLGVGG